MAETDPATAVQQLETAYAALQKTHADTLAENASLKQSLASVPNTTVLRDKLAAQAAAAQTAIANEKAATSKAQAGWDAEKAAHATTKAALAATTANRDGVLKSQNALAAAIATIHATATKVIASAVQPIPDAPTAATPSPAPATI